VCAARGSFTGPLAQLVELVDGCRRETDLDARHMSEADTLARTRKLVELGDRPAVGLIASGLGSPDGGAMIVALW
jgi:hypothetical protein